MSDDPTNDQLKKQLADLRKLSALEASILHWTELQLVNDPYDVLIGGDYCALCAEYNDNMLSPTPCQGCPVRARTGLTRCQDTPYEDAVVALRAWKDIRFFNGRARKRFHSAALAETAFLKDLRRDL